MFHFEDSPGRIPAHDLRVVGLVVVTVGLAWVVARVVRYARTPRVGRISDRARRAMLERIGREGHHD